MMPEPTDKVVVSRRGLWLRRPAAEAMLAWNASRVARGLSPIRMVSGGRTRAEQLVLWQKYGPPRAAPPGSSRHEDGDAADLSGSPALLAELAAEAPLFGWVCAGLRFTNPEPWHFEFSP